jgi:hypothetical protein
LLVVSLFRPGAGIDLWLALLVTGVVTVVLWAVARPFRRLVSMVSLTREQFGGIVPGAGTGPMSRVWQRVRGTPTDVDDRQTRWWDERRGAMAAAGRSGEARPESEPGVRVSAPAADVPAPRSTAPEPASPPLVPTARRAALPAPPDDGVTTGGLPNWNDSSDVDDRVIYRRPDAVPLRPGGVRPVQAEIVDGVPVYRIYRPHPEQTAYFSGGGRAD